MKNYKSKSKAVHVASVGNRVQPLISSGHNGFLLLLGAAFLAFLAGATYFGKLPLAVLLLYFVASMAAFVAYAFDKSAARKDKWRTQESTLHLYALIGGWPGALAAQQLLRHKSRKPSFQMMFWVTVALNCGALGWLLSTSDAAVRRAILDMV